MRLLKIYISSSMSNFNFVKETPMDLYKKCIQCAIDKLNKVDSIKKARH